VPTGSSSRCVAIAYRSLSLRSVAGLLCFAILPRLSLGKRRVNAVKCTLRDKNRLEAVAFLGLVAYMGMGMGMGLGIGM